MYAFLQNQDLAFLTYIVIEVANMLTKRSTLVDQILRSESMDCKLSVAIFMASRTHLATRECGIYEKKSKNYQIHEHLCVGLVDCAIYFSLELFAILITKFRKRSNEMKL